MAVLVTGGAGYIGSHTVRRLREAGIDTVVLDKTGTITSGVMQLIATHAPTLEHADRELIVTLAASAESRSEHPIARAVSTAAPALGVEHFTNQAGSGVVATVDGEEIRVGRRSLFEEIPDEVEAAAFAWLTDTSWGSDCIKNISFSCHKEGLLLRK